MKEQTGERILLIGSRLNRKSVEEELRRLNVSIDQREDTVNVEDVRPEELAAVVLVQPFPDEHTTNACGSWSARLQPVGTPLFLIVSADIDEGEVRRLYKRGVTAVFEWPRERAILPECLSQMIRLNGTGSPGDENVALAEAIRLRIEADETGQPGYAKQIRITASDGIASLKGIVDSLWKKQAIEDIVAATPGVKAVQSWGLIVKPPSVPDVDIAKAISTIIDLVDSVDSTTLAFSVNAGVVTLTGTVQGRSETYRAVRLLAQVRGVRDVVVSTRLSPASKLRDSEIARSVLDAIQTLFPHLQIRVSVFNGAAVLSGSVQNARQRDQIEILAARQEGVRRTINKIAVAPPGAGKQGEAE
jgi:osmotically-inducible protein OsmY